MRGIGTMRIQYISDLHLEFNRTDIALGRAAHVLVLAGDIGDPMSKTYSEFLSWCARDWAHVIVVAGNHELYNRQPPSAWKWSQPDTVATRIAACRAAAAGAGPNVHFLERDSVVIGGVRFLGCTLWSDVSGEEEMVERRLSDYSAITVDGQVSVVAAQTLEWHLRDRAWLEAELAAGAEGEPVVVVTHHLPTYSLIAPRYLGSPLNVAFASHLDDVLVRPPVRAWICGHSHTAGRVEVNGVRCLLNPVGYPYPLEPCSGYRGDAVIEI